MLKQTLKRGFTLIELLVVIAIIGILASVVLASLNSARDKGSDAAVKANLSNMRAQAELTYDDDGGDYTNVCTDAADMVTGAGGTCNSDDDEWAASAPLSDGSSYFCVDYTGVAATTSSAHTGTGGSMGCS